MSNTLKAIFQRHYPAYRQGRGVSRDQHEAVNAVMRCGEPELGSEYWRCQNDDYTEHSPHGCRHRSCPRCAKNYGETWLERVRERLLPCDHFHVIMTLPHELNALWRYNRRWSNDVMLRSAVEAVQELLRDARYLGAEVGVLAAVHTWGRSLSFHPHGHLIVSGGGLRDGRWIDAQGDYLLPAAVLKAKFRGKWLSWANAAYDTGAITLPTDWTEADWRRTLRAVARKRWAVRIQAGYRAGVGVSDYLSRYVRGGPIKNSRLLKGNGEDVRFRYTDHRDGKTKTMTMSAPHFIDRVLSHVPPKGAHTVRGYGLYATNGQPKRTLARTMLPTGEARMHARTKPVTPRRCPHCGAPLLHAYSTRRDFSLIRRVRGASIVQQDVKADPPDAVPPTWPNASHPLTDFFCASYGRLN
ncbi:MAG: transposase [Gammaproteobacteria bacterium]|nr:transposase [Gammaproteobacteria bacterium]MCP5135925.1 transposase [Gammaproteobacteria bacterium]MCP5137636.1 transposase [Gammaproteobacteria bacterium]MCP5137795.1 transposase [Gammaproteobacteria bacterium]